MSRIVAQVKVENAMDSSKSMEISALVDTGAAYLSLPLVWMDRFGEFKRVCDEELVDAKGQAVTGKVAGPAEVKIGNFRSVYCDIVFIDMEPDDDGDYLPLLGYIPMEAANLAVDMLGHRLLSTGRIDLR